MCKAPLVTPERSATPDGDRLAVGFEATPLLGRPTGVGAFCAGALSGLADLGSVQISAFAVSWRRRHQLAALVPSGVSWRHRAMPARPLHASWSRTAWPPVELFIGPQDVVHGTNFVVPPTRTAGRVVTVHDLTVVLYPELCDPPTLLFPELIRRAVADGAWVHTPSRFIADQVTAAFSIPPERVRAVHHGIPPVPGGSGSMTSPVRLPEGCHRYVLAVGTVEPRKDYPTLVAAFDELAAARSDVALVVVGQDGWGADRFTGAVEASPFRGRIVRTGYLDEAGLGAALRQAAVLAYPSRYEGFGFPPLQAMAVGVPVVTTSAGSLPEVVGDGALLVDSGDRDGLAGALDQVLGGGADIDRLVQRGLEQSRTFTWEACADGLVGLYRDARDGRRSRPGRPAEHRGGHGPESNGNEP